MREYLLFWSVQRRFATKQFEPDTYTDKKIISLMIRVNEIMQIRKLSELALRTLPIT